MIDFHTHILPEVDDGSTSIEMSRDMFEVAQKEMVKYICATPHFIVGEYELEREDYDNRLKILNEEFTSSDIKILSGLEIYINPDLVKLYKEKKIWGINDSRYMLIELPMQEIPIYTEKILYELRLQGLLPIIAHPERNLGFIKDKEYLTRLVEQGTLLQMNTGSIVGKYGTTVKKFAEELVSMNMVHLLGSDGHNSTSRPLQLACGFKELKESNPTLYNWIIDNEEKIVRNEDIEVLDIKYKKKKKSVFFHWFKK